MLCLFLIIHQQQGRLVYVLQEESLQTAHAAETVNALRAFEHDKEHIERQLA